MNGYRCSLCDNDRTDFYLGDIRMLHCNFCQVVFLTPHQRPSNLTDYYQKNVFYAENATNPEIIKGMVRAADFYLDLIVKYLKDSTDKLLVDVGSNYGILVEKASELGFRAVGLEKNKILVEMGRRRGLNILSDDLSELVISRPVDIITAMHVLEHLTDPRSFIKEVHKKLTTNGLLVIGVPNIESYLAKKDGLSWRYIALEHLFYFSKETLCQLLNKEGFEILAVKQDGTNLTDQSIGKLLHYLFGKPIIRDRFQPKSHEGRNRLMIRQANWLKKIIKKILILVIKILSREDFIIIIAQKKT